MDEAFRQAILDPPEFECFGLPLRPFTLGHYLFLLTHTRILEEGADVEDLILAVYACSMPHDQVESSLRSRSARLFAWFWRRRVRSANLVHEAAAFRRYLSEGKRCPRAAPPVEPGGSGPKRAIVGPEPWRLLSMLMVDFGLSEREALDMTVVKAHALWAIEGERNGSLDLARGDLIATLVEHAARERAKRRVQTSGQAEEGNAS